MKYYRTMKVSTRGGVDDCKTYHAARICSGDSLNDGSPDIEVLASSAPAVGTAIVTLVSTCVDIVLVQECEAHILRYQHPTLITAPAVLKCRSLSEIASKHLRQETPSVSAKWNDIPVKCEGRDARS